MVKRTPMAGLAASFARSDRVGPPGPLHGTVTGSGLRSGSGAGSRRNRDQSQTGRTNTVAVRAGRTAPLQDPSIHAS